MMLIHHNLNPREVRKIYDTACFLNRCSDKKDCGGIILDDFSS